MPYRDVQCSMFDSLVSKSRLQQPSSTSSQPTSHMIDEEALAQRIASKIHIDEEALAQRIATKIQIDEDALAQRVAKSILPLINDIVTKAIEAALNRAPNATTDPETRIVQQEDLDGPEMSLYDDPLPITVPIPSDGVSERNMATWEPLQELSTDKVFIQTTGASTHAPISDAAPVNASPMTNNPNRSSMPQALDKVRSLVGDANATWTCDAQRDAMEAVLALETDVMALMCTGSGKTMLAVVPSLLEESVTVVVLPLKSLMMDYRRKLDRIGVLYEEFKAESTSLSGAKKLILVSADRAKSSQWHQALAELNERIPVVRTIFDEAQLAFTSDDYRSSLRELHELRQFPMQVVVLSGTVPPRSESTVIETFGLGQNMVIFRTPTVRPEHKYILEKPRSNNKLITGRVKEIIKSHRSELTPKDRVLLFVPYLDQGEHIAEELKCEFYHGSKTLSDTERLEIHGRWIDGTHQFMVCTSAFGAGNDYSHVRIVIHAGTPQQMIGTIQEMGRGGRDHQLTYCYVLPRNVKKPPTIPSGTIDHKGTLEMHWWLHPKTRTCLRFGLTKFCDIVGTSCSDDPTYQKCSACLPVQPLSQRMQDIQTALEAGTTKSAMPKFAVNTSSKEHMGNRTATTSTIKRAATSAFNESFEASKRRKVETQMRSHEYVEKVLIVLQYFDGICAYCKLLGKDTEKHPIIHCPFIDSGDGKGEERYVIWRDKISYQGFHDSICYMCHVPQTDDRLHRTFETGGRACDHPDVIAPVAYGIFHNNQVRVAAEQYFGQRWTDLNWFMRWINSKPAQGHPSNLMALFWWYYFVYLMSCLTRT
jgi:superfamily II DNA helicase RecQ